MQDEEDIAEKEPQKQFLEQPVRDPQTRLFRLMPRNNLRIPFKWFDEDSDAEEFIKAVARDNNIGDNYVSKVRVAISLCNFLDVVWNHRHLRTKQEGDPPRMSLQECRIRHWKAVIDESSLARGFSQRLVRHVTFMILGASLDFDQSGRPRNKNSDLNDRIDRMCHWFGENDPNDVNSFEDLQPERKELNAPNSQIVAPTPKCKESRKRNRRERKRKYRSLGGILPKRQPQKQQQQTHPISPSRPNQSHLTLRGARPDGEVELPE